MRLHKTGHIIADTVSDLVGDLPDGEYKTAYGILRHNLFRSGNWFEFDKGLWNAEHYDGNYRLSFNCTQPLYSGIAPSEPHDLELAPWRYRGDYTLICPPTQHVCEFFGVDYANWLTKAIRQVKGIYLIRNKGESEPIDWDSVRRVITFNSTVGFEALRRGIPVISDPEFSTIGSYCAHINAIDGFDRSVILDFAQGHQFKLVDKGKICRIINHYLSSSASTAVRQ